MQTAWAALSYTVGVWWSSGPSYEPRICTARLFRLTRLPEADSCLSRCRACMHDDECCQGARVRRSRDGEQSNRRIADCSHAAAEQENKPACAGRECRDRGPESKRSPGASAVPRAAGLRVAAARTAGCWVVGLQLSPAAANHQERRSLINRRASGLLSAVAPSSFFPAWLCWHFYCSCTTPPAFVLTR